MEAVVTQQSILFGEELRRRRLAADLTLAQLARTVFYSTSQLSKVERGIKAPSRELARQCDAALGANGELIALAGEKAVKPLTDDRVIDDDREVGPMPPSADWRDQPPPMSRRHLIEAGILSIPAIRGGRDMIPAELDDSTIPIIFRTIFDQYRRLGQIIDPARLLPTLITQVNSLQELSLAARSRTRSELLVLAARYAEYAGWLAQEAGQEQAALWWTRRAGDLARAGGDQQFASYGLVRHALVTLYRDDAAQTIGLARQARQGATSPRIQGLAAQREAQGHALAGDYDACMRALDSARALLHRPPEGPGPVIGTTNLSDPAEMVRGWCLYDLGRPRAAAEVLDRQLRTVPGEALRTQVRYGARRALAYAAAGETEHACQLAAGLLDACPRLGSATVAKDLRALARTLSRHPKNPSVRDIAPRLGTATRTGPCDERRYPCPKSSSTTAVETATRPRPWWMSTSRTASAPNGSSAPENPSQPGRITGTR